MKRGYFFVLAIAFLVAGCCSEMTGNPREGGLFCWSEAMAIERLEKLKAELNQRTAQTDNYRRKVNHDKALLKKLNDELEKLRIEVDELEKLRADNQKLEAALNAKRKRIETLKSDIDTLLKLTKAM